MIPDTVKRAWGLVLFVAAFVTVLVLYLTGPSTKVVCPSPAGPRSVIPPACASSRTNSWERIKGAITGHP